ncbi:MAG TPA: hypothetical protein VNY31_07395 [Solirubrobacteraceae bacterium]|jgi:hypothetical protein|nr:hypothetical protein [Solirubrobacteraceae bacterium]
MPLDELYYPQLYQHSQQLGLLTRWNGRSVIARAGVLALGAAIGGFASGGDGIGLWICLAIGLSLLLGAMLIGRAEIASARDVKTAFDQTLSMYEKHPDIKAIREHLENQLPPRPEGVVGHFRKFFNF